MGAKDKGTYCITLKDRIILAKDKKEIYKEWNNLSDEEKRSAGGIAVMHDEPRYDDIELEAMEDEDLGEDWEEDYEAEGY